MPWRALSSERGLASSEYAGILAVLAAIFLAVFALGLDGRIGTAVDTAVCRILGERCAGEQASAPERCLTSQETRTATASVLIAVVKIDKDSTLIRENYSDGSARIVIIDNSEVAGELFAGAKGKFGRYGLNYSASADAGVGLAGARVFDFDDQEDADAFQESVQAAGGFDGILRDIASYNDEIPLLGWDNPLGGLDDAALDALGVGDDGDLPQPDETYYEAKAFLRGEAGAGGGLGDIDADLAGLIQGAGVVKVVTSGDDRGDVEFTVELEAEADGSLTVATLGGGAAGKATFTATISLDAQNGYEPETLTLKGTAGYTGNVDVMAALEGDELADISKSLEEVTFSSDAGVGQGIELSAELDLQDPQNLQATLDVLAAGGRDPAAVARLVARLDSHGTLGLDTYDLEASETEGEIKVGLGIGGGAGGSSSSERQAGRAGQVRPPGGSFSPRICRQPS